GPRWLEQHRLHPATGWFVQGASGAEHRQQPHLVDALPSRQFRKGPQPNHRRSRAARLADGFASDAYSSVRSLSEIVTLRIIQTAYYVTACLALSQASGCTKQVSETRPAAAVSSAIPIEPNGTVAPPLTMRSGSSLAATKSTALRLLEWKKRASAGASDDGASTE